MSLNSNFPRNNLQSPFAPRQNLAIFHRRAFQVCEYRVWRRRRLKTNRTTVVVRSHLGPLPFFENLFQNLLSQFPSVNSLDLIAPSLGFASGAAIYLSRFNSNSNSSPVSEIGEWILFASPTPFNRFVMLRCPSISFEGGQLLDDVNDKLVKEDRHFVKVNSGKIQIWGGDDEVLNEKLVYQRVCVSTDDGGVISLDWPETLDLMEERGLDTTLLLIPGTAEGSMDNSIRSFVCESLKRGCFPVVMNPRGCGGSPLTTPRLFTAADSDDIRTAVQFINRARPWTTLMGVGWGYGANMLTKYLAEVGEKTSLIAATCINNPFDLEEATRSSPYHIALDRKLTGGLVDILRSNKELFRGKAKAFDVEKALLANSIRDFEKSISMISYGFEAIEDFYASSSTRNVVGNVKIPVLFIQSDDAVVPLFSIPRSLIAENPFASLLLCSCLPSSVIARGICALPWCQHLTIQWLAAVELGLLKGRHPLLKDVDVSINPSEGLALLDARASDKSGRVDTLSQSNVVNGYTGYPLKGKLEESDTPAGIVARFRQDPPRNPEIEDKVLQQESNGTLEQTSPGDAEFANEEVNPFDVETGQVLQTAEVAMNMLDVTMPGTLTEEQKKKVLTAVGQGKTVINALQDAVPQDVREKLTTAVSGILPTQGTNVKLEGLLNVGPIVASGLNSKIQEKVGGLSSGGGYEDPHSLGVDDLADSCNDTQVTLDKTAARLEPELQSSNTLQNPMDTGQVQPNDIQPTQNTDISREGTAKYSDYNENGSDAGAQPDFSSQPEGASGTEDSASDHNKTDQSCPASSAEAQPTEREGIDDLKSDESSMNSVLKQDSPDSPTFSVSQALDSLTDIDDSTQVAVNSVFGVIEDMISQLEDNTDVDHKNEVRDQGTGFTTQNPQSKEYNGSQRTENRKNDLSLQSGMFDNISTNGGRDSLNDSRTRWEEKEKHIESSDSFKGNSGENDMVSLVNKAGRGTSEYLASNKLFAEHPNKVRDIRIVPFFTTTNKYSAPLYQENLRKYLLSKIQNAESLDLDRITALFLEYIPEEGQWKPLEQPGDIEYSDIATQEGVKEVTQAHSPSKADRDEVIEPSYVIMDVEEQQEPVREYDRVDNPNEKVAISNDTLENFVKTVILDSLKVEVDRRLSAESMKEMEPNLSRDMEHFANAVSVAAGHSKTQTWFVDGEDYNLEKLGTLNGEHLARAMSFAILETDYLRSVLPYGVVVGSCLAALRKFFDVAALNGTDETEAMALDQVNHSVERNRVRPVETEADRVLRNKLDCEYNASKSTDGKKTGLQKLSNETAMVGAVTAALGASAVLVHQRDSDKGKSTSETLVNSSGERENHQEEHDNLEEEISEKSQNNIVTSLAEKAMSVAGPMVPMKEGGEVDQDRLVALLAELGQKGGMLRMVGKLALLWGGIRGAMSLTDRLILFLRVAERPLFQRILSFVGMVLVLWSPVVIPLLPTLVQSWATHSSSKFAELICIIGLYSSIPMLVMLWGRRIRGYENPFEQYGLDFTSPSKIQNFLKGLIGGVVVVLSVHSLNSLLGCVRLSWPSTCISNYSDFLTWLKVYGKMLLRVAQGLLTATGVALVEELIFRSWLPDEIATDLGYYRGIIISGLAFSLAQRSPWAIPGLWLLSLGLAGARQRSGGSLSIPIGLRAGIMASNFVLQTGGFLTYQPNFPRWVTGTHPLHLFSGISGLACSLLLAIVLRPMEPLHQKESTRTIRG